MMPTFILGSLGVVIVGAILVQVSEWWFWKWVFLGGFVVFFCSIGIVIWQADKAKTDRDSRTRMYVGSPIELNKENADTDKCVQQFKFKVREPDHYARLSYTFEVDCDTVLRHGDVMQMTFVAPKKEEGKPEILKLLNFSLETEEYSRPHSFPPAEASTN